MGMVALPAVAHATQALRFAQDPSDAALQQAILFLSKQLGKQVTGEGYTYEEARYPDSALGCPKEGETYSPGPFDAYKFMIPVTGTNYDVRVTTDLKIKVLCTKLPTATPTFTATLTPTPTNTA